MHQFFSTFRERPPGLIQHVLTVLVSCPGCCSCTGLHLRLRASDCAPGLVLCFMGPWTFAWIGCPQLPTTHAKAGRTAHAFTAQGGTRRHLPMVLRKYCRDPSFVWGNFTPQVLSLSKVDGPNCHHIPSRPV